MSKVTLLTAEGLIELKEELKQLKEVRRIEIAAKLKEAISYREYFLRILSMKMLVVNKHNSRVASLNSRKS